MKKLITLMVISVLLLTPMVFAGIGSGTFATSNSSSTRVVITVDVDATMGTATVTYGHNGETRTTTNADPDPLDGGTVTDAASVTFSNGKQFRIDNSEVQWSKTSSPHWSKLKEQPDNALGPGEGAGTSCMKDCIE